MAVTVVAPRKPEGRQARHRDFAAGWDESGAYRRLQPVGPRPRRRRGGWDGAGHRRRRAEPQRV